MARIVASTRISAAPEVVWALNSDPNRYPELVDATDRMVDVPDEPMQVGYRYREYGGIRPFKGESRWCVTEFEPPRRQVHVGTDGTMTVTLVIEVAPVDGGSQLTLSLDLRPRWFLAPLNAILWPALMRRRTQGSMDATAATVKRVAESMEAEDPSRDRAG